MKKISLILLLMIGTMLSSAKNYTIIGKGSNGEVPSQGSISYTQNDTYSELKVYISDLVQKSFTLCNMRVIDDYSLKYDVFQNKSSFVIIRQDSSNPNVYYFEVPNFYEGQSGTILYKTTLGDVERTGNPVSNQDKSNQAIRKAQAMGSLFGDSTTPNNQVVRVDNSDGTSSILSGRDIISLPQPGYNFNQEGKVVVRIEVNAAGKVVDARVDTNTTVTDKQTIQLAIDAAYKAVFSSSNIPSQIGTITYNFRIK